MKSLILLLALCSPAHAVGPQINGNQIMANSTITVTGLNAISHFGMVPSSTTVSSPTLVLVGSQDDASASGFVPDGSSAVLASTGIFTNRVFIGNSFGTPPLTIPAHMANVRLNVYAGFNDGAADTILLHGGNGSATNYALINVNDASEYARFGYYNGSAMRYAWLNGSVLISPSVFSAPGASLDIENTGPTALKVNGSTFNVTNGLVGIGTTAPGTALDIVNAGSSIGGAGNVQMRIRGVSGPASMILEATGAGSSLYLVGTPGDAEVGFGGSSSAAFIFTGGAERVRISSSGPVGIGTTNPNSLLTVYNGDIRLSTNTGSRGIYFQDGSLQVTAAASSVQTFTWLTDTSSGTYSVPAGARQLRVVMVGGGGGGGGATAGGGAGTGGPGQTSFFWQATSTFSAVGGKGGAPGSNATAGIGGVGGSGGLGTAGSSSTVAGANGGTGSGSGSNASFGGYGGATSFGGSGYAGTAGLGIGGSGVAGTGAGGGGAIDSTSGGGGGGAAGQSVEGFIVNPSGTWQFQVGAGGAAGTGTNAGGAGARGQILVYVYY